MTFLYAQFVKNKVKITNIEACMLIVNSRKASLRIKKKFRISFSPPDFLLFSFRGRFFLNMRREEIVKKVLYVVRLLIMSLLLCCTATQQWEATGQPEVSKFGMMLQRHIFKRIAGAGLSDV